MPERNQDNMSSSIVQTPGNKSSTAFNLDVLISELLKKNMPNWKDLTKAECTIGKKFAVIVF